MQHAQGTPSMTIGRLAKATEVNIDTIRFYERQGLLPAPHRRPSGYREYGGESVQRLNFIRRAKHLGFSLTEIAELLSLSGGCDMGAVRDAAEDCGSLVLSCCAETEA